MSAVVGWVNVKEWSIPHLKALQLPLSSCNETFENLKVTRVLGMISEMPKLPKFQSCITFLLVNIF